MTPHTEQWFERTAAGLQQIYKALLGKPQGRWWFFIPALVPPSAMLVLLIALPAVHTGSRVADAGTGREAPAFRWSDGVEREAAHRAASLWRQEQFLSARLAMADGEAIGLSLDLADSVLVIELGGVPLRRCDLRDLHVSPSLYRHPRAVAASGGLPMLFSLERAEATIPKAPIRVVEAPRDTAEANARPPQDLPVETRAAHVVLHFAEGLTLHLRPESSGVGSALRGSLLLARERVMEGGRTVRTAAQGGVPAPRAWIEVVLSPEDARAVYRALPAEASLALRLP